MLRKINVLRSGESGSLNLELALIIILFVLACIFAVGNLALSVNGALLTASNRITATDPGGGRPPQGGLDITPPSKVTLAALAGDSQVSLSWNAAVDDVGVAGYAVYRSSNAGLSDRTNLTPSGISGLSYVDSTALNGSTYYYEV
jgi:hypothetical protein